MTQVQIDQLAVQKAYDLLDIGQYKEAIELSRQINDPSLRAGILIDAGSYAQKRSIIQEGIDLLKTIVDDNHAPITKSSLLYNLANGYSEIYILRRGKGNKLTPPNEDELRNAKYFYRKAIAALTNEAPNDFKSQLWTNYANCLSAVGRTVEAVAAFHEAARFDPRNGIALGNLAVELEYFSQIVDRYRHDYLLHSHDLLKQVITGQAHLQYGDPGSMTRFQAHFERLKSVIDAHENGIAPIKEFRKPEGKIGEYVYFCHEHRLFLNAWVGDIRFAPAISDDIHYGPIVTALNDNRLVPRLINILNEIRESYATARYLCYLSQQSDSDTDRYSVLTLYDAVEFTELNGLSLGLLKAGYTKAFDVLDKVARVVNLYFEYGNELNSFWNTFATKESRGQTQETRYVLRPELAKHRNVGMWALGDICIDYHENHDVSLRQFDTRRNLITHHFLVVSFDEYVDEAREHQVGLSELKKQTLEILKLAKQAIIYAVMAVNHAESMKRTDYKDELIVTKPYQTVAGKTSEVLDLKRSKN